MGFLRGADFQLIESQMDGGLRLSLVGALDAESAPRLEQRLAELRIHGTPVRLDLARLEAIDTVGIEALVAAHADAQTKRWRFEIEPGCPEPVLSVLRLAHLGGLVGEGS